MMLQAILFIFWCCILHIVSSSSLDVTRLEDTLHAEEGLRRECPDGFFSIKGSSCLKVLNDSLVSWAEAEQKCKSEELGMAIHLDDIALDLRKYILANYGDSSSVWLGASGDGSAMRWKLQPGYSNGRRVVEKKSTLWRSKNYAKRVYNVHCLGLGVSEYDIMKYPTSPYWVESCTHKAYTLCQELPVIEEFVIDANIPVENDVLVLKRDNFIHALNTMDLILVNFYSPRCRFSKNLVPEYEKAAKMLKVAKIPLAKVDAIKEKTLKKEQHIGAYPTVMLFKKGAVVEEYNGGRKADAIVRYMLKHEDPNYIPPPSAVGRSYQINEQCYPNEMIDYMSEQLELTSSEVTSPPYFTEKTNMHEEFLRANDELRDGFGLGRGRGRGRGR